MPVYGAQKCMTTQFELMKPLSGPVNRRPYPDGDDPACFVTHSKLSTQGLVLLAQDLRCAGRAVRMCLFVWVMYPFC